MLGRCSMNDGSELRDARAISGVASTMTNEKEHLFDVQPLGMVGDAEGRPKELTEYMGARFAQYFMTSNCSAGWSAALGFDKGYAPVTLGYDGAVSIAFGSAPANMKRVNGWSRERRHLTNCSTSEANL